MSTQLLPEIVGIEQPVLEGWKAAYVYVTGNEMEELRFVPIVQHLHFGVDDEARCVHGRDHTAPNEDCGCGFYAWHSANAAKRYMYERMALINYRGPRFPRIPPRSLVVLRVTLYGTVTKGYVKSTPISPTTEWASRASNQWIHDVFFEKRCAECDSDDVRLGSAIQQSTFDGPIICHSLRPLCSVHMDMNDPVPMDTLMNRNDVVVHWGLPSE